MLNKFIFLIFSLLPFFCSSQTDSTETDSVNALDEVVITGFQNNNPKFTSINIEPYKLEKINEKTPFNLSDALSKVPGISQISTGNSISKPVIRGLYGNRILVLLSGARFDNQQWQDEHGLGLSQIGIDRVEIIKGPASLLYGSDALGGVINVIEEKPDKLGRHFDFGTQTYLNTVGSLTDLGFSRKQERYWYRLRLGLENNADYSDGNNSRVLNSRNQGYYLKAGFGLERKKWKQENSYNFSVNQYGFILQDTGFVPDARWSSRMAGPHHIVILNLLNSQNTFYLNKSLLKLNVGGQSNLRMEDEGAGHISLNMHLFSALQSLRWEKNINRKTIFVCNEQFTFENNTNYGGRIIIPDANILETNISGYFKFFKKKFILETGAGINYKFISTLLTRGLNIPGEPIKPFNKNSITTNAMLGGVYNINGGVTLKANVSSGFRAPNLAELSSNGVHEGVYRYELGDPNLKVEHNVNSDLTLEANGKNYFFSGSVFYNRFFNYVYLESANMKYFGFDMYKYTQQNALLTGGEFYTSLRPKCMPDFQWKEGVTLTRGRLDNGDYLPFIPAYKLSSALRYEKNINKKIKTFFAEAECIYMFQQNHPAQFESSTSDYGLYNLYSGATIPSGKGSFKLGFNITNLANKVYADHLSRIKYYGLYNQGINFVASVRKTF